MPVVPDPSPSPTTGWAPDMTCCPSWGTTDPAIQARAVALATFTMWTLTGRRFGLTSVTAQPCNPSRQPPLYQTYPVNIFSPWGSDAGASWAPYIYAGQWHNVGCGGFNCCAYLCGVDLDGPVTSVTSVTIDGVVVPPTSYVIQDEHVLKRTDGDCWPFCTDTFLVTYLRGLEVPPAANIALGDLTCAYAAACEGGACALPQQMTSLARGGISVELLNPRMLRTSNGQQLTNIASVDRVIFQLNPGGLAEGPVVMSPDTAPIRYTTWP